MSAPLEWSSLDALFALAALLVGYLLAVFLSVAAGALYCAWAVRWYGELDTGPVPADVQRFLPRGSFAARCFGLVVESAWQALAFVLRAAHDLRVLRLPRRNGGGAPVLVVPGYVENSGTMWWLARRLARAGFDVTLVEFPSTTCAIEQNVAYLAACVQRVRDERGGEEVAVVAHSMGGVIARTLILSRTDHGVRTLIAIGSPFRGTHLARIGARLHVGRCVGQMVPGSEFMRRYPPTLKAPVPMLSLVAPQENIVTPPWSAAVEGAQVRVLEPFYGHEAPLFAASVCAEVEAWLLAHGTSRAQRPRAFASDAERGAAEHALHRVHDEQQQER